MMQFAIIAWCVALVMLLGAAFLSFAPRCEAGDHGLYVGSVLMAGCR
jgi:hypothetical protein